MILSWILVVKHIYIVFLVFTSRPTFLIASRRASVFLRNLHFHPIH